MSITVAVTDSWAEGRRFHAVGTITVDAATTYAAGGLSIGTAGNLGIAAIKAASPPIWVDLYGSAGFIYNYIPTTYKIMIFTNAAGGADGPLVEHSAATCVAGVLADTIHFHAIFKRFV
jgi:hypothetical protein